MKPKGIASGAAKGIWDLGKNVVYEAGQQAVKVVEEGVEELTGAKSTSSSQNQNTKSIASNLTNKGKRREAEEIEQLRRELRGPKRDLEKEIAEVRRKKKEEEEFLEQLEEQRRREKEEAEKDAQALTEVFLPGSGQKPKKGSIFLHRKQRKTELGRGAKH